MSSLQGYIFYISVFQPVLGTCAIFSATEVLAQTKTGGTRRGGAKVKNNGAVAVARKNGDNSRHFRTKFCIEI